MRVLFCFFPVCFLFISKPDHSRQLRIFAARIEGLFVRVVAFLELFVAPVRDEKLENLCKKLFLVIVRLGRLTEHVNDQRAFALVQVAGAILQHADHALRPWLATISWWRLPNMSPRAVLPEHIPQAPIFQVVASLGVVIGDKRLIDMLQHRLCLVLDSLELAVRLHQSALIFRKANGQPVTSIGSLVQSIAQQFIGSFISRYLNKDNYSNNNNV